MVQIIGLTEQEFTKLVGDIVRNAMTNESKPETQKKEWIRGIHQLAKFLNCSAPKAQRLKNDKVISCFQDQRLILFDPDTVRAEMAAYNQSKKRR